MNLPSGDHDENSTIISDDHLGVFVSGVVVGLRRHMTRAGHVTGARCMLRGAPGLCLGSGWVGASGS